MKIITITNQLIKENTYLLSNEEATIIIDPGSDSDRIIAAANDLAKPVVAILLTHAHFDHIAGLDAVREALGNPAVYVSDLEKTWLTSPIDNLSRGFSQDVIAQPADHLYTLGQTYEIAGFTYHVVSTPGHSWGGVSLIFPDATCVFSGDALFKESVGRTDLPTSNYPDLIAGITKHLLTLPDHYTVYPGHGSRTTIGHEKQTNPHLI